MVSFFPRHADRVLANIRRLATPVGRRMFSPKRLVVYTRDGIRNPGILLREGATSGPAPTVHVLEIRTRRDQRDSTDLLPYLPKFRSLFTRLPLQHKKSIVTKALHIPVSDIEYVIPRLCPFLPCPMDSGDIKSPLPLKFRRRMIRSESTLPQTSQGLCAFKLSPIMLPES
jgi:hypothetical protein